MSKEQELLNNTKTLLVQILDKLGLTQEQIADICLSVYKDLDRSEHIIRWILIRIDNNNPPTYQDILNEIGLFITDYSIKINHL